MTSEIEFRCRRLQEYVEISSSKMMLDLSYEDSITKQLHETPTKEMLLPGLCDSCGRDELFLIDLRFSYIQFNGREIPNWRERLVCRSCKLNARMRMSFYALERRVKTSSPIWLMESKSPFAKLISTKFSDVICSEFVGADVTSGTIGIDGIRHEDCTSSSLGNDSLGAVLSFDVLEHVPDYLRAFEEMFRVLRPGGSFIWSAPFDSRNSETKVRARVLDDGSIEHIEPPLYHADPLRSDGVLCFQTFGWAILQDLLNIGFSNAYVEFTRSVRRGLLGSPQPLFVAEK